MNKLKETCKALLELAKVRITIAVSLTTIVGYVMATAGFSWHMLPPTLGLFLIACGSAALNQYQERHIDAVMERTRNRPLPSGRISPKGALIFIFSLIISGSLIIYFSSNMTALLLALAALVWYNGIYTLLKKETAFAVVPGSVIGALPPAVGWAAAGGDIADPRIILLAFFFFIWQIPHFWLLLMKYGTQYARAGLPSLTEIYSEKQLKRITFLWTLATAITALFIPFFNISTSLFAKIAIAIVSVALIISFSSLLFHKGSFKPKRYFIHINFFLLLIIISLYIDAAL